MKQELIDKLLKLAKPKTLWDIRETINEDACVYDYCGGNTDDAYEMGERDGQTELARDILDELNIPYERS